MDHTAAGPVWAQRNEKSLKAEFRKEPMEELG